MSISSRLTQVFQASEEIQFDDSSRIILMSDCHRGDNSKADDFAINRAHFFSALSYYYEHGFTYIELGDGDELWENDNFTDIKEVYSDVFCLLRKFYVENRLLMLWGNHDMVKKHPDFLAKNLYNYYDSDTNSYKPLFDKIKLHEGLILHHKDSNLKIFLVHGHQGDLLNDTLWPLGRFLCKTVWRNLEILGINNLTSPAKNITKRISMEKSIFKWVQENNQMLIAGHFHRPTLPSSGRTPYFNTGSCVNPQSITGIEIEHGEISLINWHTKTNPEGTLCIVKDTIAGPVKLHNYSLQVLRI